MDIKQILVDAGIEAEVAEKASKNIGKAQAEEFIPKVQYNKIAGENKTLKTDYDTLKLESDNKDAEITGYKTLKTNYDTLVTEHNNYKTEIETKETNSTKTSKLKESLKASGFNEKIIPLLTKEFSLDKIEIEGDKIKGWEELSKGVIEGYKDFITTTNTEGNPPATPPANTDTEGDPFVAGFDQE